MTELLHITELATWRAAESAGAHTTSTRGASLDEVGFIHCSLRSQLRGVAEYLYGPGTDTPADLELVVLVIDSERLDAPVRFERPAPGAEEFPHVYGPVPVAAVVDVIPVTADPDGRMVLPE